MNTMSAASTPLDLSTRRAVVIGGTGRVGEGIVSAWLEAGAEVVVPSRTSGRIAALRAELPDLAANGRLHLIEHEYTEFDTAVQFADRVEEEVGQVSDVIASIGGWWQGKALWEVDEAEWNRFFVELATAHVATARAWIPRLSPSGSYHLILGGSATTPVPGSSLINMEQAALKMMHEVLSAEAGAQRRVFAHILGPVATRQRPWVDPEWVSNADVGTVGARPAGECP